MVLSRGSALMLLVGGAVSCTAIPPAAGDADAAVDAEVAVTTPPPAEAAEPLRSDFWFNGDPRQGAVIVGRVPTGAASVSLNGQPLKITADGFFLMGFGRDAENSASLVWQVADGNEQQRYLPVRAGNWKIEHVNVSRRGGARTSAEFRRRRGPELAQINAARRQRNQSDGWRQDFIWPVKGRLSGFFGSQRIYRGTPGSYHSGMDIAAPTGTPFVAPADGVVILAARSAFTLEGHLLMIDHGMGLNSAFLHCSELLVNVGDPVKQGQAIGRVGNTGRATGPHLHWGMKWNAARVDPLLLVPPQ